MVEGFYQRRIILKRIAPSPVPSSVGLSTSPSFLYDCHVSGSYFECEFSSFSVHAIFFFFFSSVQFKKAQESVDVELSCNSFSWAFRVKVCLYSLCEVSDRKFTEASRYECLFTHPAQHRLLLQTTVVIRCRLPLVRSG